ncbi:MAG: hypothetical protein IJI20_00425 [Firmicutes bacterium]|nr:hypothetical protein [Bacillota bacterium]
MYETRLTDGNIHRKPHFDPENQLKFLFREYIWMWEELIHQILQNWCMSALEIAYYSREGSGGGFSGRKSGRLVNVIGQSGLFFHEADESEGSWCAPGGPWKILRVAGFVFEKMHEISKIKSQKTPDPWYNNKDRFPDESGAA